MSGLEIREHEPRTEIMGSFGMYSVYGWTTEIRVDDGWLPLRGLVSFHQFRWCAERARRRWLAEQSVPHGGTRTHTP